MGYGIQWDIPYPIPATTPECVKFNHVAYEPLVGFPAAASASRDGSDLDEMEQVTTPSSGGKSK